MAKQFEKTHTRRIIALILLCVVIFVAAAVRVFQFQIVDGAKYQADAEQSHTKTVAISAARGEIVDRNGIPFTQNKASFNLEFDYTLMKKTSPGSTQLDNDAANETIYNLIKTFEGLGEEWLDNLPISMTGPHEFLSDASETDISRLKKKMADLNSEMADYATAEDCLYWIYRSCGIQKYQENGKCTHCGQSYEECDYKGYSGEYARKIAGVRYEMLLKDFSNYNTRFTFAEDISASSVAWLREQTAAFPGITIVEKATRTYISGDVASHLLGVVGPIYAEDYEYYKNQEGMDYQMSDTVGKSGIERAFESQLRGKNGEMTVYLNSKGEVIGSEETVAPVAGKTIQLTLDFNLQKEVQQILADYIEEYNSSGLKKDDDKHVAHSTAASIVILDVKTGGLLTSVSYPYYDINEYLTNYNALATREDKPLNNWALNGLYRPGSTFKPIVAAAALSEGLINPDSTILCPASAVYTYYAPSFTPGCLKDRHYGNANLDVRKALEYSCNIFFYDTGRRLGIDTIDRYAEYFGLGVDTGLEISSLSGRLTTKEDADWQEGNVVQAAIGQMNTSVTPLQMACEAMTLANQGVRYETHLVKNILSYDGSAVLEEKRPVVASSFDLSDEAFEAIRDGMVNAGLNIAAPNQLTDLGYSVAVKTGSPQVNTIKTNNGFIAFAPADDPQIAISCMVEDGYGTNKLLRRLLLAWERAERGETLPEDTSSFPDDGQILSSTPSSSPISSSEETSFPIDVSSDTVTLSEPGETEQRVSEEDTIAQNSPG